MHIRGSRGQIVRDFMYDASGTITTGGTPQLVLPERLQNSSGFIQNISDTAMYVEFGGARATATLTSGAVSSTSITNNGFGYTTAPMVIFLGGGDSTKNPNYLCPGLPGFMSPACPAKGHTVLGTGGTAGTVISIVIDDPGANYVKAPYVFLRSHENDPYGAAAPSTTSGLLLTPSGGNVMFNGTAFTTDAISIYCVATGKAFACKYTLGG